MTTFDIHLVGYILAAFVILGILKMVYSVAVAVIVSMSAKDSLMRKSWEERLAEKKAKESQK